MENEEIFHCSDCTKFKPFTKKFQDGLIRNGQLSLKGLCNFDGSDKESDAPACFAVYLNRDARAKQEANNTKKE